jgi:uncharacterized membrane protein
MAGRINKTIFLVYILTAIGLTAWLGAIFWAPYLRSHASPWQGLVYAVFSPVCHQIPSRSFHILGQPLAVCARCLGIYSGFFIGVALYPFLRGFSRVAMPRTKIFILISLPIVMDTLGNFVRLWETPNQLRFVTGLLWGTILPYYLITGLADLALRKKENISNCVEKRPGSKNMT